MKAIKKVITYVNVSMKDLEYFHVKKDIIGEDGLSIEQVEYEKYTDKGTRLIVTYCDLYHTNP